MRSKDMRIAHLRSVPMFQTCTDKELLQVARLAEQIDVPAGEVLVREGRLGHEFYVVAAGKAEVAHGDTVVAVLGPGDYFGELALLDPQPRTATVTMVEAGEVLEISQREFWSLLREVPALPLKLLQGMARRLHAEAVSA